MQITEQNIEELILLYVDDELEPALAEDVLEYIVEHPQYAALLEDYQQTILTPDTTLFYDNKEELLQPERRSALLIPVGRVAMVAAATIAILLCSLLTINYLKNDSAITGIDGIAKSHTGPARIVPNTIPTIPTGAITIRKQATRTQDAASYRKSSNRTATYEHKDTAVNEPNKPRPLQQEVVPLPSQSVKRIEQHIELNAGLASRIPSVDELKNDLPAASKLPEWLPVEPEKLEAVNELVAQFKEVKERLQASGLTLKNASFALRIGDKEIGFGKKNLN